jgi:DNA-binding response OmpR family regulator
MSTRILVIEDDPDIRRGLCVRLQAHGYATESAADAITGHSLAAKNKPSLILLDLGLPGGDGIALLKRLKSLASTSAIPVIVLTGRDPHVHEAASRDLGAVGFFQKPPEIEQLIAAIREQIGAAPAGESTTGRVKRILVVEDDADTRMGLMVRLRKAGYEVAFAADASTALTVAKKENPNLVLLDLGLPGGDGFLVLQRLKGTPGLTSTPVIVVSARDPEVNRARALKEGADAYFHKPADMPELLDVIKQKLSTAAETS